MSDIIADRKVSDEPHGISFGEAFCVWARIALLSFGGHAAYGNVGVIEGCFLG
jgi:chromate transport protein ChrA